MRTNFCVLRIKKHGPYRTVSMLVILNCVVIASPFPDLLLCEKMKTTVQHKRFNPTPHMYRVPHRVHVSSTEPNCVFTLGVSLRQIGLFEAIIGVSVLLCQSRINKVIKCHLWGQSGRADMLMGASP